MIHIDVLFFVVIDKNRYGFNHAEKGKGKKMGRFN